VAREIEEIMAEIDTLSERAIFFVDDNIAADHERARTFFMALAKKKVRWIGQISLDVINDPAMLDLIAESGCVGLLVGFESLNPETLVSVGKEVNCQVDYALALSRIRQRGIVVYGTFLLGLQQDGRQAVAETVRFAIDEKLFIAAFNHAIPFPGTRFYTKLQDEGRLNSDRWWLSDGYRFGDVPFTPECATSVQLSQWCQEARQEFFSIKSILRRALDSAGNAKSLKNLGLFGGINLMLRREVSQRHGLHLGKPTGEGDRDATD
jgi:radical SAM superfamily enzyme YgiQ (UPF0313 family)